MTNSKTSNSGKYIFLFLLGMVLITGYVLYTSEVKYDQEQAIKDSLELLETTRKDSVDRKYSDNILLSLDSIKSAKDARFEVLNKKFVRYSDEFTGAEWFIHKNQINPTRTTLLIKVSPKGDATLESQFHGDSWIFHTHAIILMGKKRIETPIVSATNPDNRRRTKNGVWENVVYSGLEMSGVPLLFQFNRDEKIKVRLEGDRDSYDFILPEKDKIAIIESAEYANYFR